MIARARACVRRFATGSARPVQLAVLRVLLGTLVLKDLMFVRVAALLLREPTELAFPWVPWLRPAAATTTRLAGVYGLHVLAYVAAACLVANRFVRSAALFLAALYGLTFFEDQLQYTNNIWLCVTLLVVVALGPSDPDAPAPTFPRRVVQILVTIIYATSGLAKLTAAWCSGLVLREALYTYYPIYGRYLGWDVPALFQVGAIAALLLEVGLAGLLWHRRTRPWAIAAGIAFHLSIDFLMPVRLFSYLMIASYVVFLEEDELRPVLAWAKPLGPIRATLAAFGAAFAIDYALSAAVDAMPFGPYQQLPAVLGLTLAIALFVLLALLRVEPIDAPASVTRALRRPLLAGFTVAQVALALAPALGSNNRFGWRMFTELCEIRATSSIEDAGGAWRSTPLWGRWSHDDFRPHWDSWGEERIFFQEYVDAMRARDVAHRRFKVDVEVRRNRGATEEVEIVSR